MPRKNPNGLGSVYERSDGRWVAAISLGGKRVVRYAASRADAQRLLVDLQGKHQSGLLAEPSSLTVAEFLDHWLETVGPDLKPTTLHRHRQLCRIYLVPTLGSMRLQRVEPRHILAAIGQWRKQAKSARTVNHAYRVLHRAFALAVKWGVLSHSPCARVERPKPQYRETTVWTLDEARRFLAASEEDQWFGLWAFLAGSGARLGEALALEWGDLDLEGGTAAIRRSLVWIGARVVLQTPKTKASVRTVLLPPFVLSALRRWKQAQAKARLKAGAGWRVTRGAVFTTRTGTPPSPSNLRRSFLGLCDAAGVPRTRIHDLRHLAATLLVASGLDPKAVQRRLGHATLAMTLGLYAHHVPSGDQAAVQALERALGGR